MKCTRCLKRELENSQKIAQNMMCNKCFDDVRPKKIISNYPDEGE